MLCTQYFASLVIAMLAEVAGIVALNVLGTKVRSAPLAALLTVLAEVVGIVALNVLGTKVRSVPRPHC